MSHLQRLVHGMELAIPLDGLSAALKGAGQGSSGEIAAPPLREPRTTGRRGVGRGLGKVGAVVLVGHLDALRGWRPAPNQQPEPRAPRVSSNLSPVPEPDQRPRPRALRETGDLSPRANLTSDPGPAPCA